MTFVTNHIYAGVVALTVLFRPELLAHQQLFATDTISADTSAVDKKKNSNLSMTGRLHSMGFFGFSGCLASTSPGADMNINYTHKNSGVIFIKSFDLEDFHGDYNFAVTFLYHRFHLTKKLVVTPYAGFVFDQSYKVCGDGSDVMALVITSWKFHPKLSIEHLARFSNVAVVRSHFDWLNRARLVYSSHRVDASIGAWLNNDVFDDDNYTSVGISAAYARVPVAKHVTLTTGFTAIVMAQASAETHFVKKNGLLLTIAATVD